MPQSGATPPGWWVRSQTTATGVTRKTEDLANSLRAPRQEKSGLDGGLSGSAAFIEVTGSTEATE